MKTKIIIAVVALSFFLVSCVKRRPPYLGVQSAALPVPQVEKSVPEQGIRAEMKQEWETALDVYRGQLKKEPGRSDLWERIADIQARLKNLEKAAEALQKAAELAPANAAILHKLAQTYSLMNQPLKGLEAMEKAVQLEPENIEYLKARAQLANWSGNSKTAADSYRRLARLLPHDDLIILYLARADAWSGFLDRAVDGYKKYLDKYPKERAVLLEYVKTETWRGNYPRALKMLDQYQQTFGEDADFLKTKADVLSRAARPAKSMSLLESLLENDPSNYEILYSRTIALHYARRPQSALDSLELLKQLRPQSRETEDMWKFIQTPLRSFVQPYAGYYFDSDDLSILSGGLELKLRLSPHTSLKARGGVDYLRAENNSPFRNIDGSEDAWHYFAWIGGSHRFSPAFSLDGYIGTARAEDETTTPIYNIAADVQPGDTFKFRLSREYGYYIISPRAVSLGIKRAVNSVLLDWDLSFRSKLITYGAYETFSDDNRRWEAIFFPRTAVGRTENLNLDLGFRGWWFGFDEQLGNGYWDPEFFQSYMGALVGYWKISENDGLSFQAAAGVLKDNTMDEFVFGYSIDTEGIFGIYKDLMLKLRASYLHNVRQASGAFDAFLFTASLMLRL